MTLMFVGGSLFMVYLSTIFFREEHASVANLWIGAIFLAVAAFSASLAARAWRSRQTPLIVTAGGRVSYGDRELCAAGSVETVEIVEARSGEGGCEVGFKVAGKTVFVPSQYFAHFGARDHARPFAALLASTLNVHVRETF